ncbi:MAG: Uma2 family endonuclease [Trueperaceae bacterium]
MTVAALISEGAYLKLEDKHEERHEYVDGVLRLMAGITEEHNFIIQNFVLKLTLVARAKQCRLVTEVET